MNLVSNFSESSQITVVVGEYDRLETNTTEQEIAVAERVIVSVNGGKFL